MNKKLCYGLLGKTEPVKPWARLLFRFALKRCAGACCGQETLAHFLRLQASLERLRVVLLA